MNGDPTFAIHGPESLGAAIRHYRREAGITQDELARRTSLNRTYVSALEQGHHTVQMNRVLRLLRELGLRMTIEKADP